MIIVPHQGLYEEIATNLQIQNYTVNWNSGSISQVLAAGSSLTLNTLLTETGESYRGVKPNFKNISDQVYSTILDETEDKFLFPSNLYTYENDYTHYIFRTTFTMDHPDLGNNAHTNVYVRLRRKIDDSIVAVMEWDVMDKGARSNFKFGMEFNTFVGGESDPYVVDGMYIDITNDQDSDSSITLTEVDVRLFKI
jgi:hypothetical protein